MSEQAKTRRVVARRRDGYTHELSVRDHTLVADEPEDKGGADQGPTPMELLATALASCTAITIEMYADRKEWELGELEVAAEYEPDDRGGTEGFTVTIRLPGGLTEEQTQRIRAVAAKCPVHRALTAQTAVSVEDRVEVRE